MTGLKNPQTQNRDLGNIPRWGLLMGGVQLGGGGELRNWGEEISVNGEKLLPTLSPTSS